MRRRNVCCFWFLLDCTQCNVNRSTTAVVMECTTQIVWQSHSRNRRSSNLIVRRYIICESTANQYREKDLTEILQKHSILTSQFRSGDVCWFIYLYSVDYSIILLLLDYFALDGCVKFVLVVVTSHFSGPASLIEIFRLPRDGNTYLVRLCGDTVKRTFDMLLAT